MPPSAPEASLTVVVAYLRPGLSFLRSLRVPAGTTLRAAVLASGLLEQASELQPADLDLGVFGQARRGEEPVADGDRVEVYRALSVDPKAARIARARAQRGGS